MKLIIISGPSGSGKTTLSKQILKKSKNGVILNTDNYYKTGLISRILSKVVKNYFDRDISFNSRLLKKDLKFIYNNGISNYSYKYDYKYKFLEKEFIQIKNIKYIIIEGIFVNKILKDLSNYNCLLIKLKVGRCSCMNRVIKRDFLERGKSRTIAKKDFLKAWELFHKKEKYKKSEKDFKFLIFKTKPNVNLIIQHMNQMRI